MPTNTLKKLSNLEIARAELSERALEAVRLYYDNMKAAYLKGDHEVVMKSLQWLLERSPRGPDGKGIIDVSVDKIPAQTLPSGPTINIGFKLGGIDATNQKAIEGKVVKAEDDDL